MRKFPKKTGTQGFSLVELMLVISIVGMMATLSIPSFYSAKIKAARSEMQMNTKYIHSLLQSHHAENDLLYSGLMLYGSFSLKSGGVAYLSSSNCSGTFSLAAIGFHVEDCPRLRYRYTYYPSATDVTPTGSITPGTNAKYYGIMAESSDGPNGIQFGNPPIGAGICGGNYSDRWVFSSEGSLSLLGKSRNNDAVKTCF